MEQGESENSVTDVDQSVEEENCTGTDEQQAIGPIVTEHTASLTSTANSDTVKNCDDNDNQQSENNGEETQTNDVANDNINQVATDAEEIADYIEETFLTGFGELMAIDILDRESEEDDDEDYSSLSRYRAEEIDYDSFDDHDTFGDTESEIMVLDFGNFRKKDSTVLFFCKLVDKYFTLLVVDNLFGVYVGPEISNYINAQNCQHFLRGRRSTQSFHSFSEVAGSEDDETGDEDTETDDLLSLPSSTCLQERESLEGDQLLPEIEMELNIVQKTTEAVTEESSMCQSLSSNSKEDCPDLIEESESDTVTIYSDGDEYDCDEDVIFKRLFDRRFVERSRPSCSSCDKLKVRSYRNIRNFALGYFGCYALLKLSGDHVNFTCPLLSFAQDILCT